ncbi:MAG: hypothetical protein EHM93_16660 [Bacteroidales bacterium]|nr:MAG: hypothetical protein EHM93_16660 [Bacteroidales bacterium]
MTIKDKVLICFTVILISINSFGQGFTSKYMIGIWQNSPEIASGWSDNYQFFSDGTFRFNFNQMDCQKRMIYYKGNWIVDKEIIQLTVKEKLIIVGGKMIQSFGSCGSDSTLENGIEKRIVLDKPEIKLIKIKILKKLYSSILATDMEHIKIDSIEFYRIENDPTKY